MVCRHGVVQRWVLQSSMTCFACCFSFFSQSYTFEAASHVFLFCKSLLCHLSQTHSCCLPISWLVFLLFLRTLVEKMSWVPLGNPSGPSFWAIGSKFSRLVAICDSTQFVLHVSIFRQLLSHFSLCTQTQPSISSSWLTVMSSASSNEMMLSLSKTSFVLSSFPDSFESSLNSSSLMSFPQKYFQKKNVFHICLNHEKKRSALCCAIDFRVLLLSPTS